jgi:hypothetical protein
MTLSLPTTQPVAVCGIDKRGYGCARITVKMRAKPCIQNYLKLMRLNYAESAPEVLARLVECIPKIEEWWVCNTIIPPDAITEVYPVGEATPHYLKTVEQIAASPKVGAR